MKMIKLHWDAGATLTTAVGERNHVHFFSANSPRVPDSFAITAKSGISATYYSNYLSNAPGKYFRYTVYGCKATVKVILSTPNAYARVYCGFCDAGNAGVISPTTTFPSTIASMPMVQGKTIESLGDARVVYFSQYCDLRHLTGSSKLEYNSDPNNKAVHSAVPVNSLEFFIGAGQFDDGVITSFFSLGLQFAYEIRLEYFCGLDELNN